MLGERHQGATTKPSSVRPTLPSLLSLLVLLCFLSFHCKLRWLMDPCSFSSAATATTSTWRVVDAATQRNRAWTQARNAEFARQERTPHCQRLVPSETPSETSETHSKSPPDSGERYRLRKTIGNSHCQRQVRIRTKRLRYSREPFFGALLGEALLGSLFVLLIQPEPVAIFAGFASCNCCRSLLLRQLLANIIFRRRLRPLSFASTGRAWCRY